MVKLACASKTAFGMRLEREQADGLLLQLLDARRAVLAGRREDMDDRAADRVVGVQPAQEQRDRDGRRMRDHVHGGVAVLLDIQPGFDQRRAQPRVRDAPRRCTSGR